MKLLSLKAFLLVLVGLTWVASASNGIGHHSLKAADGMCPEEKNFLTIPVEKIPHHPQRHQKLVNFLKSGQRSIVQKKMEAGAMSLVQKSSKKHKAQDMVEVQLSNYLDTQYTGIISVGRKSNKLRVVFYTGSTLLWVNSIRCNDFECKEHTKYDYEKSPHFTPVEEDDLYSTLFGSGELTGVLSKDWVYVGDLIVKNYEFAEIVRQQAILDDAAFDGVMGLSFPEQDEGFGNLISIIDAIKDQGLLKKNIFSFYLQRDVDIADSKIIFGGYDEDLLIKPISWGGVVSNDYWMIKGDNILVGGKDLGLCATPCYFIMDTGTSILTGPTFQLDLLLDSITVDDDCKNYYDLPDITFVIDGQEFSLSPVDYVLTITSSESNLPYSTPEVEDIQDCVSVFYPMDLSDQQNGNVWILGDTFLSKFYTIFDRDNMRVGVARQKDLRDL